MRNRITLLSLSLALALTSVPVLAKQGASGKTTTHAPKSHAVAAGNTSPKGGGAKTTHAATPKAPSTGGGHAKTTTGSSAKGGPKTTTDGATKKGTANTSTASNTTSTSSTSSTSSTTSTSSTSTTWTPTNPVAQKLSTKSNLLTRAKNTLPPNTDLNLATAGFKNFGQFVAAINVSNNLHLDFGQLKAAMTGTTLAGTPTATGTTSSLGQAIHQLRPTADADAEAARATAQANAQIQ